MNKYKGAYARAYVRACCVCNVHHDRKATLGMCEKIRMGFSVFGMRRKQVR